MPCPTNSGYYFALFPLRGMVRFIQELQIMTYSLFEEFVSLDNLIRAFQDVAEGKSENEEFIIYSLNLEENLINLQNRLVTGIWRPHNTVDFYIREPKLRHISRPVIEDRIVHHAILQVIEEYLDDYFSQSSYACRKGRGTHAAVDKLQMIYRSAIGRWGFDFCVIKGDFRKFFESINIDVLKEMLSRLIADERLLSLIFLILDGFEGKGLPIGFLLSQGFSNLVGSIVDYFVTDILGVGKYYIRYADDFRIIVHTRQEAMAVLYAVDDLVCNKMHQSLSEEKTEIVRYSGGDTFCGYVVCPHHLEAKRETVKRHERRIGKKMRLYEEGKITLQKVADSVHSAVDYLIKTGARSEKIENAVLFLYKNDIKTRDFKKLISSLGLDKAVNNPA